MVTTKGGDTVNQLDLRMSFRDHEYHTMHDGDLILFSVEDYQPFEPESCLDEYFLFCNITVNGKPTDRDDLTSGQYSDMVATTNEGTYYAHY